MNLSLFYNYQSPQALITEQQQLLTLNTIPKKIMDAPVTDPSIFFSSLKNNHPNLYNVKQGTTTLSFIFKHGVIMAVDSRSSMGSFRSSHNVQKCLRISNKMMATLAGGAADCQFWLAWLSQQIKIYQLKNGKEISVAGASRICVNLINYYKSYGLSMGLMLAGVDDKGPNLYYIDTEANRIKNNIFSVGSGMTHAYGILDSYYKYDMTIEEAVQLGIKAIYHATHRDSGSGGYARCFLMHEKGCTQMQRGISVDQMYYKFVKQKGLQKQNNHLLFK